MASMANSGNLPAPNTDAAAAAAVAAEIAAVVCTDGSSTIRLSLYRHLKERGLLSAADGGGGVRGQGHQGRMTAQYRALVGMTRPLDQDRFELLKNEYSDLRVMVSQGVKPFTFWCVPMTGNRMCWMLDQRNAEAELCPEIEDFTQDQQAIHNLCESVRAMPSPVEGILLGEILDLTPSGTMLSLPREEGHFSTWTYSNVALMGDGQPITQAGYDAVELANVLYAHSLGASLKNKGQAQDQEGEEESEEVCSPPSSSSSTPWSCSNSTPTTSDGTSASASATGAAASACSSSHETKEERAAMMMRRGIEARLRSYEAERRAEAEHAVRRSGQFGRLLLSSYMPRFMVVSWLGGSGSSSGGRIGFDGSLAEDQCPQAGFLPKV
ncbi:hypothetical protein BGX23_012212 [Mortierella sp. AD031]|nr:hypothetical protein BGX23_012212 [Mortierella sp. AD031]KAG0203607.1 hypothetical protein BGX33_009029 [Mortierella sp. NVP41]